MKLAPNAGTILKRAWSIRFMVLAALLSGAEVVVPFLDGYVDVPQGIFAATAGLISAAALFARLIVQRGLTFGSVE